MGVEVNVEELSSHLCTNKRMGIAACVLFDSLPHHQIKGYCSLSCKLIVNGDNIWLVHLLNQYYKEWEANKFSQVGFTIETCQYTEVKKSGFRMVYRRDI